LLEGGSELTEAVATLVDVAVELQAAMKASRLSALAPTTRAEPRRKLLRLTEDPKFGSVPMKDLHEERDSGRTNFRGNVYSILRQRTTQIGPFVKTIQ
jgi:hypothetical protein